MNCSFTKKDMLELLVLNQEVRRPVSYSNKTPS